MCLLQHELSWKFASLLLIELLASYGSRETYKDLQASLRPVRHTCHFLHNRERIKTVLDSCRLLPQSETVLASQCGRRDTRCFVRQSNRCDARVTALHDDLEPRLCRSSRRFTKCIIARESSTSRGAESHLRISRLIVARGLSQPCYGRSRSKPATS
jgi:hypothetical protein